MSARDNPLFSLRNVTKAYGAEEALRIDSLDITAGGIHLIAGPNGAGKTTLLEILCGLTEPSAGTVLFRDKPLFPGRVALPSIRRSVTMVLQNPYLFHTSVDRTVSLALRLKRIPRAQHRRRIDETLSALGIKHLRHRHSSNLSGGERQRLALASAMASDPDVLILDEPLSHVDSASAHALMVLLRDLAESRPVTIILSTHQLERVLCISDHEVYLEDGRLRPIPMPNLIPGEIIIYAGETFFVLPGVPRIRVNAEHSGRARISIPPESVIISHEPLRSSVRNSLPATVLTHSPQPDGSVELLLDAGFELRALLTPESVRSLSLRPNTRIVAGFKTSAVSVFQPPAPP